MELSIATEMLCCVSLEMSDRQSRKWDEIDHLLVSGPLQSKLGRVSVELPSSTLSRNVNLKR